LFIVNVTFQNQSNQFFIHDKYSEWEPWAPSSYPENRFYDVKSELNNESGAAWAKRIWWRPYHALQVTDGEWVNTVIDPIYYLDGRIIDISQYRLKNESFSDPFYIKIVTFMVEIPFYIYNIADVLLLDVLPNLDKETYYYYLSAPGRALKAVADFVWGKIVYFVEGVQWVVHAGAAILAASMRALAVVILVPFWVIAVLLTNGIKRFFVIMARDGFGPATEYADEFFRNSISMIKGTPVARVIRRVRARGS
jgi:hypothetical protein